MLKLRTPIKTVLNPELISDGDAFAQRILGNYRQIGVELAPTDLLHVTNEPPEVFVMDGGMTNLFAASNVENTQIQKTQIINNLINRIVLSADTGFSYQDNVYVTNILHKLGIRQEKKFLGEVQRMFRETREHREAVQLYWEHLDSLQSLIREYQSLEHLTTQKEEVEASQPVLHLHEEIQRRLQTAAIYRILQNFYESATTPRVVTNELMMLSEPARISREILLNRLREEVRMEPAYLTYRHENYYEGDERTTEAVTVESVSNRISSAVLLNLIDNIYDSVYERLDHRVSNWLSTEQTYYGAAENTLYRIEQNTGYLQYLYEQTKEADTYTASFEEELSTLQQLVSIYEHKDQRFQQSIGGNMYETERTHVDGSTEVFEQNEYNEGSSTKMVHLTLEGDAGDTIQVTQHTDALTEAVEQTYRQSILRNQQYMNALQKIIENGERRETAVERQERMQRESRLSLEHPEVFLQEYREADAKAAEETERIRIASERLLSPEQQVAHELIREYLQAPQNFYHSEVISEGNLGILLYDIQQATQGGEDFGSGDKTDRGADGSFPTTGETIDVVAAMESGVPSEVQRIFTKATTIHENETFREREFTEASERLMHSVDEQIVIHRDSRMMHLVTERVMERWHERRNRPVEGTYSYEDLQMPMVHRSKETVIDEEVITSMQEQLRKMESTQQTVQEQTTYRETTDRTVINNIVHETLEHNTQTISDMVNSSVKRQLDEISDKVYGKIEKQLKNERRRRGL